MHSCRCKVVTINCLEAEYKGKRVEVSEEWERNHNYKGVYDMILDNNRLVFKPFFLPWHSSASIYTWV